MSVDADMMAIIITICTLINVYIERIKVRAIANQHIKGWLTSSCSCISIVTSSYSAFDKTVTAANQL